MIIKNNKNNNSKIKSYWLKKHEMKDEENWEYIDRTIRGKTDFNENKLQFMIYSTHT